MNINAETSLPGLFTEERSFAKKELIYSAASEPQTGGIIRSGTAVLESIDPDGVRRILSYYTAGDIYLVRGFPIAAGEHFVLVARTACQVDLIHPSPAKAKPSAGTDILRIDKVSVETQKRLLTHIHILGQHTLRQKILVFLRDVANGRASFSLPFSLTDCADYLAADRSAMMRELAAMKEEGILSHKGRLFRLFTE